jgi:hypothetical protein
MTGRIQSIVVTIAALSACGKEKNSDFVKTTASPPTRVATLRHIGEPSVMLGATHPDLSSNTAAIPAIVVYRRNPKVSSEQLDSLRRAISLRRWPRLDSVAAAVTVETIADLQSAELFRLTVRPAGPLVDGWYAVSVADLTAPFAWSEPLLLRMQTEGSSLIRFRLSSDPVVRRVVLLDKTEPFSDPKDEKHLTAIDIEFSERLSWRGLSEKSALVRAVRTEGGGMDNCSTARNRTLETGFDVLRVVCRGRVQYAVDVSVDGTVLTSPSGRGPSGMSRMTLDRRTMKSCGASCLHWVGDS